MNTVKKIIAISLLSVVSLISYGQVTFEKVYGGSGDDIGYDIKQTYDGGYIILGETDSYGQGGTDLILIKTDSIGNVEWSKTYGGGLDDEQSGNQAGSVEIAPDSGFVVCATTLSFGAGNEDVYVFKTDKDGVLEWTKTYGGTGEDRGFAIRNTTDGNFIIAGETGSFGVGARNVYIIKIDNNGDTLWTKTHGQSLLNQAYDIIESNDGGFLVTGYYADGGGVGGPLLLKLDNVGNQVWLKVYDYGGGAGGRGNAVVELDSTVAIIGMHLGVASENINVIYTDSLGNILWNKTYEGSSNGTRLDINVSSGNSLVVTGQTSSFGMGSGDIFLIELDLSGNKILEKTFGGTAFDRAYSIIENKFNEYVLLGYNISFEGTKASINLVKVNKNGITSCDNNNSSTAVVNVVPTESSPAITTTNTATVVSTGGIEASIVLADDSLLCQVVDGLNESNDIQSFDVSPNPSSGLFNVNIVLNTTSDIILNVVNSSGQTLQTFSESNVSSYSVSIDLTNESSGVYYLQLQTSSSSATKKIIIQ